MTITQLPSGSWRIRQMSKGVNYSIVVPHKPTEKQAYQLIYEKINNPQANKYASMTFSEAYKRYLDIKGNILSPSTLRGYKSLERNISDTFKRKKISDIDNVVFQKFVNDYSKDHAPKSVRNMYGFILTILNTFNEDYTYKIALPQKKKADVYIPSEDDVRKLLAYFKDTKFEAIVILLSMGLRRSEATALTIEDLDAENNIIHINKAKVQDGDGNWIVKSTKTTDSERDIVIPPYLTDLIVKQGYIYNEGVNNVYKHIRMAQDDLGLPHFSMHKLRHYFISYAHHLGISNADIMKMSGHSSEKTLVNVYRHEMELDSAKQTMADQMSKLIQ